MFAFKKSIPIDQLDRVRNYYKILAGLHGKKMRVIFRGPRRRVYPSMRGARAHTLKSDANRFDIYFY